jgi:hypothetical protein
LTGLIVFIAAVNGAVDNKLTLNKAKEDEEPFRYNYGFSFFSCVLSFLMQEFNGILNVIWYIDYFRKYRFRKLSKSDSDYHMSGHNKRRSGSGGSYRSAKGAGSNLKLNNIKIVNQNDLHSDEHSKDEKNTEHLPLNTNSLAKSLLSFDVFTHENDPQSKTKLHNKKSKNYAEHTALSATPFQDYANLRNHEKKPADSIVAKPNLSLIETNNQKNVKQTPCSIKINDEKNILMQPSSAAVTSYVKQNHFKMKSKYFSKSLSHDYYSHVPNNSNNNDMINQDDESSFNKYCYYLINDESNSDAVNNNNNINKICRDRPPNYYDYLIFNNKNTNSSSRISRNIKYDNDVFRKALEEASNALSQYMYKEGVKIVKNINYHLVSNLEEEEIEQVNLGAQENNDDKETIIGEKFMIYDDPNDYHPVTRYIVEDEIKLQRFEAGDKLKNCGRKHLKRSTSV